MPENLIEIVARALSAADADEMIARHQLDPVMRWWVIDTNWRRYVGEAATVITALRDEGFVIRREEAHGKSEIPRRP